MEKRGKSFSLIKSFCYSVLSLCILSFTPNALAQMCDTAKETSDRAVGAMNGAAAAGAGAMAGGIGLPSATGNAGMTSGGKGGALGAAAMNCSQAALACAQQCRNEANMKKMQQDMPGMRKALQNAQHCEMANQPKCQQGADQAAADQQHQQQAQQAMPSMQPPQKPPEEGEEEEEELVAKNCAPGLQQIGMGEDNTTPICGCPSGMIHKEDLANVDDATAMLQSSYKAVDDIKECVAKPTVADDDEGDQEEEELVDTSPIYERDDTSADRLNGMDSSRTQNSAAIAPEVLQAGPKRVFGTVTTGQRTRSAFSSDSDRFSNPFDVGNDEEEESEDEFLEVGYVPPKLNGGYGHKYAAYKPKKSHSNSRRGGKLKKKVKKAIRAVASQVDEGDVAKQILDPKQHENPNLRVELEGQKIAGLLASPDPLKLCELPTRIRLLEGSGVYGRQKAAELRQVLNQRIHRLGGETSLTMFCATSDNSF